ncbi:protein-lysine N-methyltransferase SMYD4-like [Babylonia areolata]|uniref:protein-lysine N-methyltransferase SMYD4-like n=1 Tax=Babylonia areolata TaxID=304850 RepID=UPI003FD27378
MSVKQTVVTMDEMEAKVEKLLKQSGQWEKVLGQLGACGTNTERVQVVLGVEEVLPHINPSILRQGKSLERAQSLRTAGNQHFKAARYDQALACYSQAVCFAPQRSTPSQDSTMLALCFGNRSAALFHLKQFRSCLKDIDNALQAGIPPTSLHKLLDRRGKCCLFLKHKAQAIAAFEEAKHALLNDCSLQDKTRQDMVCLTDQFIAKCRSLPDSVEESEEEDMIHEPTPKLTAASSHILSAADCVVLKEEAGRGRGLYAQRDIKIGEVLIVEKPYVSVVLSDYCESHCHHCCSRCFVPLPCQSCVDVVFCSAECRQTASQYHTAECQLMAFFHQAEVRLGHLALKMVAKAGYSYLREQQPALEGSVLGRTGLGCDHQGVYDSEDYHTMYHLVGHCNKRTVKDLWSRALRAAFLVKCLEQTGFFPGTHDQGPVMEEKRLEDLSYIGGHIMRHLMMLPCNAHEVSEMEVNWSEPSMSRTLEIGSAIYPVLSLINHSCDPSVVRHSYGDVCVVRAIRGVAAGEELLDNYGALYPVMSHDQRQSHLQDQYFFTCHCPACLHDWPLYMDIPKDVMHFYCHKCRGPVPVPSLQEAGRTDSMACRDCGHRQNIRNVILKVGSLEQEFQDVLHRVIFSLEVNPSTLPRLLHFLRVVDRHVHRPVACHNDCQEAVKMCYAYKANAFPRKPVPTTKSNKR